MKPDPASTTTDSQKEKCGTRRGEGKKLINLAFIGGGFFAKGVHFPALVHLREHPQEHYELHFRGIYKRTRSDAEGLAKDYGFERVYSSLDELLHDDRVDAVAVVVPNRALVKLLKPLATRRLPIFSEKPPGNSAEDADYLSKLITTPNVVAYNRRYIPVNNSFKQVVDDMTDVFFVEGHFFRSDRLQDNFALDTGIHWINYMEYLFGEITAVQTQRFKHPQNETWVWLARLTFRNKLQGLLKIFPSTGSLCERLEVHSPKQVAYLHSSLFGMDSGHIIIENISRDPTTNSSELMQTITPGPEEGPAIVKGGFIDQYQDFFAAVCSGAPTRSNFQNAVNTMHVAEAIENGVDWVISSR